jgi:hypothetical protein
MYYTIHVLICISPFESSLCSTFLLTLECFSLADLKSNYKLDKMFSYKDKNDWFVCFYLHRFSRQTISFVFLCSILSIIQQTEMLTELNLRPMIQLSHYSTFIILKPLDVKFNKIK